MRIYKNGIPSLSMFRNNMNVRGYMEKWGITNFRTKKVTLSLRLFLFRDIINVMQHLSLNAGVLLIFTIYLHKYFILS